jgi:Domain of unknown function (DUF4331)
MVMHDRRGSEYPVLTPQSHKDLWNTQPPHSNSRFAKYVTKPELARLLPLLYPGVLPNLAALVPVVHEAAVLLFSRELIASPRR